MYHAHERRCTTRRHEDSALSGPGGPYAALAEDVAAVRSLSAAAGASEVLEALVWWQGQSDQGVTAQASYQAQVQALRSAVQGLDRPGRPPLKMLLAQIGTLGGTAVSRAIRPDIALAHSELVRSDANIGGSFAEHWLPYIDRDIHYPARSMRIAGACLCLDLWTWRVDGRKPRPVAPARSASGASLARREGQTALIPFDVPSGTMLRLDPGRFPGLATGGIRARDVAGNDLSISAVEVRSGNILAVTAAGLSSGAFVTGGWDGATLYNQLALRDSLEDTLVFDPQGTAHPMHQPAWIFEEPIP